MKKNFFILIISLLQLNCSQKPIKKIKSAPIIVQEKNNDNLCENFTCNFCQQIFKNKKEYWEHILRHIQMNER